MPRSTHSLFVLQTMGLPKHMAWATNNGHIKPHAHILPPGAPGCTKPHALTQLVICNIIPQKDTMITYVAQRSYLLNNQVPTVIFSSATILAATLHYSEFTNKYSRQYGRWSFSTNNLFSTFFSPLPPCLQTTQPIQSATQPPSQSATPPFSRYSPYSSLFTQN